MADLGTTDLRIATTVTPLVAWSTDEQRDTFRHFTVHVSINRVGVGPIMSQAFTGKNLDAVCAKALTVAKSCTATQAAPAARKKLKLKRTGR